MRRSLLALALLALVLNGVDGLVVCLAETGPAAIQKLNDASIRASIKGKLMADNVVNSFSRVDVAVDAEQGTVVLNGEVQTSDLKARAEELAGEVGGVKRITNNLQVRPAKQQQ